MEISRSIDTALLRALLSYDPDTGFFTRLTGKHAGKPVGCIDHSKRGYVRVVLDGIQFYAHRLAWQYHYGDVGDLQIDHINGDRSDNRIANLRLATPRQNQRNYSLPRTNSSGYKGVSYQQKSGRWRASIRLGNCRPFAYFDTPEDASAWYEKMAAEHFGEFAKPANDNRRQSEAS